MTFREKLLALRRRDKLTQTALVNAVGVTRQAVYLWEKGLSLPDAAALLSLRRLFGVSIDALLDDSLPLPEKREAAYAAPIKAYQPAATPAPKKTAAPEPETDLKPEFEQTPSEEDEKPAPKAKAVAAPAPAPAGKPATDAKGAPLKARIAPSRTKSGNILDLFGAFLKRRK